MPYNGQLLDVVNIFTYPGVIFRYNCKFLETEKKLAEQGQKCLYTMLSRTKDLHLNNEPVIVLFETNIKSILFYGCEVWVSHQASYIDKF